MPKIIRTNLFSANILIILLFSAAVISAQIPENEQTIKANPNYRIGIGDVLRVLVPKNELLSTDLVRVGNSGTIRLPMLDDEIPAKCMTEAELSAEVTKRYKKYLLNPQVYVTVKEFNSNPIAVVGAVNTPGRFQIQHPLRLLDLITYVNGVKDNAGRTIQIIRNPNLQSCAARPDEILVISESEETIINLSLSQLMKGVETANPYVYAGDIIRVTEAEQAFVIGNVKRGATISLNEPVTLSKAIAIAGGATDDAQIKKIKILRQDPDGLNKTEIVANLKDINERKAEDILLQPDDIVDVPGPSGTKKFLKGLIRGIVPAITRAPIPVIP